MASNPSQPLPSLQPFLRCLFTNSITSMAEPSFPTSLYIQAAQTPQCQQCLPQWVNPLAHQEIIPSASVCEIGVIML
jgi:hypothetical protein